MKEETRLPDNALRELKPGEEYEPIMKPNKQYREVSAWSITWRPLQNLPLSQFSPIYTLRRMNIFDRKMPLEVIFE